MTESQEQHIKHSIINLISAHI